MSEDKDKNNKFNSENDRYLPIANIGRIIKNNLPKEVKLSKEAKETFQECLSEFINFITSEAGEKCANEKRKTISGEDVLTALSNLGFDHYNSILKLYLSKYKESHKIHSKDDGDKEDEKCVDLKDFNSEENNYDD